MGYKEITLKMPTDYSEAQLQKEIENTLKIKNFSYHIARKSLDARKKGNIHWNLGISVLSDEIEGGEPVVPPSLTIPYRKRKQKVVVVGSGPAGFFSAFVLQKAGYDVTLIERGSPVQKRAESIRTFEKTGIFSPAGNYAFGEGGAGAFSDGKLTARSKHLHKEKRFMIDSFIQAGAPEEIAYLSHPHIGSDHLKTIVRNLSKEFRTIGGTILLETYLEDIKIENGKVVKAITSSGGLEATCYIIASGHSAYETYRMLIKRGVGFQTKPFAIGCRMEHPQEIINLMQWGRESLPGVKAAEYHLTSKGDGHLPVYTFCMCPGGVVIQSTAYEKKNIVNGMSRYKRNGKFANAACVAGFHPNQLIGSTTTALEALEWIENLEEKFYDYSGGFQVPICGIQNFIDQSIPSRNIESSYPLGLTPAPLWEMLSHRISCAIREGLKTFIRKVKGFEKGNIMGLESKTSAPIRVEREKNLLCKGFSNLYVVGEGSGYAGGIISSGSDGIKAAMNIIEKGN